MKPTKTEACSSSSRWLSLCSWRFFSPWRKRIDTGRRVFGKLSVTETKALPRFAASYFLRMACLGLFVAGLLWIEETPAEDGRVRGLLARGWVWLDRNPCPADVGFLELSAIDRSIELLALDDGRALASAETLPEPPFDCVSIPGPNFIQEI